MVKRFSPSRSVLRSWATSLDCPKPKTLRQSVNRVTQCVLSCQGGRAPSRNLRTGLRVVGVGYHCLTAPPHSHLVRFLRGRDGSRRPKEGHLPGHPRARVHAKERLTRDVATGRVTGETLRGRLDFFAQDIPGEECCLIPCRLMQAKSGTLSRDGRYRLGRIKRKRSQRNDEGGPMLTTILIILLIIILLGGGGGYYGYRGYGGPASAARSGSSSSSCSCCGSWASSRAASPTLRLRMTSRRGKVLGKPRSSKFRAWKHQKTINPMRRQSVSRRRSARESSGRASRLRSLKSKAPTS